MTRNEFIAQKVQEESLAMLTSAHARAVFQEVVKKTELSIEEILVGSAIELADALEAAGVAPWGKKAVDAELKAELSRVYNDLLENSKPFDDDVMELLSNSIHDLYA